MRKQGGLSTLASNLSPVSEPETVEFVLDGSVAGQRVSASAGVPFLRFQEFNEDVQRYVQGSDEKAVLRDVTVQIHEGSYLLRVIIPAGLLASLVADTVKVTAAGSVADIDPNRAKVMLRWQERAKMEDQLTYSIRSPRGAFPPVIVNKDSTLRREERVQWVQIERYLVGKILEWGGAQSPNVHLRPRNTKEAIIIDATEDQIRAERDNLVYHQAIVHVRVRQNALTGEIDKKSYKLIELRPYQPQVSDERLQALFEKGAAAWQDVPDAGAWVNEQRGNTYG